MEIYHGTPLAPGIVIASAARLEETYGVPQISVERQKRMGEYLRRAGLDMPEPEQIVLVARHLPPGYLSSQFPGLEVVGAAVETLQEIVPAPSCPAVVGLGADLLPATEEGAIVIVDGERGRVYVNPDAQTLARYQGPTRRARRFFLEAGHVEARRGSTGQRIGVLVAAQNLEQVGSAIASGADAVFLPENNAIFGGDSFLTASEQLTRLRDVMDAVGGKPLFVGAALERVALSALARAAAWGPVGLVLDTLSLASEARQEMDALEPEMEEQDLPFGRVSLEAALFDADPPAPSLLQSVDGVFVPDNHLSVVGMARLAGREAAVICSETPGAGQSELNALLDAGATRLLVGRAQVQAIKDMVRLS